MWPPQPMVPPERQVFQTFNDRRRSRTRRRVGFLVFLVMAAAGTWLARPHFPDTEARVRHWVATLVR